MMTRTSPVLFFGIFCSVAIMSFGQGGATISGKVEDVTTAGVSGVTITIRNQETGASRVVTTDADGNYLAPALAVGPQEIRAEKTGFKQIVRTGVNLVVGQNAVINLKLEVGTIQQEITVTDEAPVVNITTSSISGLVYERQIKDLPLNGRSFDNLIALNPSALSYGLKSPQTSTSNGNTFSVSGRRPLENLFLLNGVEYGGSSQLAVTPGGVSGQLLGIDAVREFNVLTDTYSAEYGKRAGAQVSIVTQSGTNLLHGSLFEYLRNSAFDARNYFDKETVPPFRRNQFGAALGGPIKKDKLFLFGNYEGFRQRLAVSNTSVVPNAQARLGRLPNATTGVYAPVANLNPAMLAYMAFWPEANGAQLLVNGVETGTALAFNTPRQKIREEFGTLRGDYIIGSKDQFSSIYTIDDGSSQIPSANPLFGSNNLLRSQVGSAEETHVFSPSIVNTIRLGFSRAAFNFDGYAPDSFPTNLAFVPGALPGGITFGAATTTGAATITAGGTGNAAGVSNRRNLYTLTDQIRVNKGVHQISAGVWFQRLQDNEDSASRRLGQATFASLTTFLAGTFTNFQVVPNPNALTWKSTFGAWFVQDNIKLLPRLSLQIGLRHEFTTGWNEGSGRAANWITDDKGVLITDTKVGTSVFSKNNAKRLFGPRLGLAWDVFGDGKTAIRAGFGTYYTMIDSLAFLLNSLPPTNGAVSFANRTLGSILPIIPSTPVPAACSPTVPQPCTTYAPQGVQADAQTPTAQEWNFAIEHQVNRDMALRVSYVGSFAYHQLLSVDPNAIASQVCATASCLTGGQGTARGAVVQGQQYIPVGTRPNQYLSGGFFWLTQGKARYNALQVELTRRMSHGFQFRGNYTFSKNLDMNSGLTGAQANNQAQMVMDRNDFRRDWGPSALNVKHQASISSSYDLPFGSGKRFFDSKGMINQIIGGWQLNGIVTLLSGFPFTPTVGSNRSGNGDTRNPDRPDVNPSFTGPVILGKQTQWYNPAAFSLPGVGTFGNLGRGVYTGPGLATTDVSLFKSITVTERVRLQFRAEAFNVFNHTNLGTPNPIVFSGTAVSPSAGLITTTATTSRQMQLSLKLTF